MGLSTEGCFCTFIRFVFDLIQVFPTLYTCTFTNFLPSYIHTIFTPVYLPHIVLKYAIFYV